MTDPDVLARLRKPFDSSKIGKLPKIWCTACRKTAKDRQTCGQHGHQMAKCKVCKGNLTTAHLHVDFVGHADVTDRLLQVDPEWTWEPMSIGSDGLPVLDSNTGLWIRLTVAGLTRIGYGHPDGKTGGDAIKEAIGDAIRNAAMRYGVALDLWRKERPAEVDTTPPRQRQGDVEIASLRRTILALAQTKGLATVPEVEDDYAEWSAGKKIAEADLEQLKAYLAELKRRPNGGAQ